jgi:hypothetical protein
MAGERPPSSRSDDDGPQRNETPHERLDRNLNELLGELRVALPGVQVLFAFLLILPFQPRFPELTAFQEKVYFVILLCTAVASALFIAPSAMHRLAFRRDDKEHLVFFSNRVAIVGLGFLAVAMVGVILLITDFLYPRWVTLLATSAIGLLFGSLWYGAPLRRRRRLGPPSARRGDR